MRHYRKKIELIITHFEKFVKSAKVTKISFLIADKKWCLHSKDENGTSEYYYICGKFEDVYFLIFMAICKNGMMILIKSILWVSWEKNYLKMKILLLRSEVRCLQNMTPVENGCALLFILIFIYFL